MVITLPADLEKQVEQELAEGRYETSDQLIEQAIRHLFDDDRVARQRGSALNHFGDAVDRNGLYEKVFIPDQE